MYRQPPGSTHSATRFPYTSLFLFRAADKFGSSCRLSCGSGSHNAPNPGQARESDGARWHRQGEGRGRSRIVSGAVRRCPERHQRLPSPNKPYYPPYARLPRPWPCERSEEHTSELQSLMRISYAVFCLKKKRKETL